MPPNQIGAAAVSFAAEAMMRYREQKEDGSSVIPAR
jgi:hypothetical protein